MMAIQGIKWQFFCLQQALCATTIMILLQNQSLSSKYVENWKCYEINNSYEHINW